MNILKVVLGMGTFAVLIAMFAMSNGAFDSTTHEVAAPQLATPANPKYTQSSSLPAPHASEVYEKYAAQVQPSVVQPTVIQAPQIVAAYVANEVAADIRYKDRTQIVEGRIDTIGKDILDDPYVTLSAGESEFRSVQAFFKTKDLQQLASLSKGQLVRVEGTCEGLMMNVQVKNSRLVD